MGQKEEAELIARYLLGITPSQNAIALYERAISQQGTELSTREKKLWGVMMRHPVLLPYVDAGLALSDKLSPLRKRIFTMFAILETETDLADRFLYEPKPFWLLRCAFFTNRAIFRGILGSILIRVI